MANIFNNNSGAKAFKVVSEPKEAGEYILNKKARSTYCLNNNKKCTNVPVGSQGNFLLFNQSNRMRLPCFNTIDKNQLYNNLYTKLDLSGVPVILDFSGNQVPTSIDTNSIPYLRYDIDPSGNLFGNTTCGINNFVKYMVNNTKASVQDMSAPVWSSGYNIDFGLLTYYDNYFYIPNYGTNTIIQTNLDGTINNLDWASGSQWLTGPEGCIVYNGYLYISNRNSFISKISITNPTTDPNNNRYWATNAVQGLNEPAGLVVDNTGTYIYVANSSLASNTITKILLANPNTFVTSWASSAQGLTEPVGLVIYGNYIYATNLTNSTITKISLTDPTTDFNASWATSTQGLNVPGGIIIYGNYIYAANYTNSTISKISLNAPTTDFNASWATSSQGLNVPVGLSIYNGYLYVTNQGNGTISKILI